MKVDKYWLANCRKNRKNKAKICEVCPFKKEIEKIDKERIR